MDSDENELVIFFKDGTRETIPRGKKIAVARRLLKIILDVRENCLTKKS
jgi:phosphopantothenoylcysteine synthetase/decarboxylase